MLSTRNPGPQSSGPLAASFTPATSAHGQAPPSASSSEAPGRRDRLREDIEGTLKANLTRGYLESEEQFRQIVEGLPDIVALTNESGTQLLFVNAAYERIWGQPRESLYRDPQAFLEGVHPEDRARVRDAIFGKPGGEFDLEFRVVRPGAELCWVWSRGFPVRDLDGRVHRIVSITEDITERVAVAESHERLLRGFTHDVKNPMGAADGYLSLLEMGVYGKLPAAPLEAIERARRCIRAALELVTELLDIERAKAGKLILEREPVDLGELTHQSVKDFRAAAEAKHQSLSLEILAADDALVLESDRARVVQILGNLVSNAVKYTQPDGCIVVSVRIAEDDKAPRHGRWVAIAVTDTGPGIPPEKHNLIFREFTRFDPGAAEGVGIGLAISQSIAHALGADITFTSALGVGTTFTLWLPRDAETAGTRGRAL